MNAYDARIAKLWTDTSVVKLVEVHELIVNDARNIVRGVMPAGLALKANDAIHLATAKHIGATEFHTYDRKLLNPEYARVTELSIRVPSVSQPLLFSLPES